MLISFQLFSNLLGNSSILMQSKVIPENLLCSKIVFSYLKWNKIAGSLKERF